MIIRPYVAAIFTLTPALSHQGRGGCTRQWRGGHKARPYVVGFAPSPRPSPSRGEGDYALVVSRG